MTFTLYPNGVQHPKGGAECQQKEDKKVLQIFTMLSLRESIKRKSIISKEKRFISKKSF
jgi:hypothetical protein